MFGYELRGRTVMPQQLEVGDALDQLRGVTAILMSRRSAKTESVLLWVFAMMQQIQGLTVGFTMATTREAARAKFLADVMPAMEELAEQKADVRILRGAGYERVEFNDSSFTVIAPSDKAFRSKAFDIIIVDEAGAADPDVQETLMPALLPTMDTSPIGMLILMGTAGNYREGNLLWDALHDPEAAVVDYSLGDDIDMERMRDWEYVEAMLTEHHPGVGTLTTTEKLKRNWSLLKPEDFAQEYLGVWGDLSGDGGLFSSSTWGAAVLLEDLPTPPKRFSMALAVRGDVGSIVAAWREGGEGRVLLLDQLGPEAAVMRARELSRKYRVPVVMDPKASQQMTDIAQRVEQLRPAPRTAMQTYDDVAAAVERFEKDLHNGHVWHYGQQELTDSVLRVKRVQMGARWKFSGITETDDPTAAQAAALALRYFDSMPRAVRGSIEAVAV